ncbi:vacuolar aminopeptidase 1 [Teratosphaeriaceae sp. CCFEE 6253]|nr:vacuolar aminopeptidase 1 [Teratosphaeriaceae sp. CCFEE 6253]
MVRNTPSVTSLPDSASASTSASAINMNPAPSPPPSTGSRQPQQQAFVNLRQHAQLLGSDEHTKWLMNRIATGVATAAEKAAWEQHVAAVKQTALTAVPSSPPAPVDDMPKSSISKAYAPPQLRILEQKNKERLLGARARQERGDTSFSTHESRPAPSLPQEYQIQLMQLEQQLRDRSSAPSREPLWESAVEQPADDDDEATRERMREHMRDLQLEQRQRDAKQRKPVQRGASLFGVDSLPSQKQLAMMQHQQLYRKTKEDEEKAEAASQCQDVETKLILDVPDEIADGAPEMLRGWLQAEGRKLDRIKMATRVNAAKYTKPFCDFLTDNPTVFHAVDAVKEQLKENGFTELSERNAWDLKAGGSYYVDRNGSSLIAFTVGGKYEPGNGAAILAGHVDALTAKLKPISQVPNKAGYVQLGVAPYAGAPNNTWWDRDLSIGGRVLVKDGDKILTQLVKLDWPIARIPTLAPHFGAAAVGPFNPETQLVPIIGLENIDASDNAAEPFSTPPLIGGTANDVTSFINTQPPRLVKAIGSALGLRGSAVANIVNWELELFDTQPATVGGLDKEFIFAGRIDDKLCSWAAIQALVEERSTAAESSSLIQVVGLFDDEEIGSGLRQGARGNLLPSVMERAVGALSEHKLPSDIMGRTYANSFLVSSDVIHAVNPNFLDAYLANHAPHLNVGLVVSADSNGHMTTDAVSTAILKRCADTVGAKLQVFQIRNDSRSGGTVGPMLSSMTGIRAVDAGIPQLSMHSVRATTGSLDPGLGVICFRGFLGGFEGVDKEFGA